MSSPSRQSVHAPSTLLHGKLTKNPGNVYCTIDDEVQYHGNSPPVKLNTRKQLFKSPGISSTASDLIKTNSAMTYMPHNKFNSNQGF